MPVSFGEALAKKFLADCGTLRTPRDGENSHYTGPLEEFLDASSIIKL